MTGVEPVVFDLLDAVSHVFLYDGLWRQGEWFEAVTQPYFAVVGGLFATVFVGAIMGMLYIYTGDLAVPTVIAILVGGSGFLTQRLPASVQRGLVVVLLIGIGLALYQAWSARGAPR